MSAIGSILGVLGTIASVAYPPAAPFIAFAMKVEPYAEAAVPLLKDALTGGPAAFSAFKTAAPDFYQHLADFTGALKLGSGNSDTVTDAEVASLGAHIVGVDPPGWTHEATVRWWENAQGGTAGASV